MEHLWHPVVIERRGILAFGVARSAMTESWMTRGDPTVEAAAVLKSVRRVLMGDTHNQHAKIEVPEGDIPNQLIVRSRYLTHRGPDRIW